MKNIKQNADGTYSLDDVYDALGDGYPLAASAYKARTEGKDFIEWIEGLSEEILDHLNMIESANALEDEDLVFAAITAHFFRMKEIDTEKFKVHVSEIHKIACCILSTAAFVGINRAIQSLGCPTLIYFSDYENDFLKIKYVRNEEINIKAVESE